MSSYFSNYRRTFVRPEIAEAFDRDMLARICEMPEADFGAEFDLTKYVVPDINTNEDYYFYKDNGARILAVAHLDTVIDADKRRAQFIDTEGEGTVVFSGALDDRLGTYIILDLLPKLGLSQDFDILLTVGEESGCSTAQHFWPNDEEKEYDYIIEFDRGRTDVVMYQYDDAEVRSMVRASGATVSTGSFSDIAYLEHLGVKAFNWGVGYDPDHGARSHAFLNDTFEMVEYYLTFHAQNAGVYMPHYGNEYERDVASSWREKYDSAVSTFESKWENAPFDDVDDNPDPATIAAAMKAWGI